MIYGSAAYHVNGCARMTPAAGFLVILNASRGPSTRLRGPLAEEAGERAPQAACAPPAPGLGEEV